MYNSQSTFHGRALFSSLLGTLLTQRLLILNRDLLSERSRRTRRANILVFKTSAGWNQRKGRNRERERERRERERERERERRRKENLVLLARCLRENSAIGEGTDLDLLSARLDWRLRRRRITAIHRDAMSRFRPTTITAATVP